MQTSRSEPGPWALQETSLLDWKLTTDPDAADVAIVNEGVLSFGRSLALGGNARPLACFVRDDGALVAGGVGRTEFNRLFVTSLWVAEDRRCRGLGTELLARMEHEAAQSGCTSSMIETMNDRVARMYARLGYKPVAVVPAYVGGFTRHIMLKEPIIEARKDPGLAKPGSGARTT